MAYYRRRYHAIHSSEDVLSPKHNEMSGDPCLSSHCTRHSSLLSKSDL